MRPWQAATRYRLELDDAFWAQLEASGELDVRVLGEYREFYATHAWAPLGAVLVAGGHLTLPELVALLERQSARPDTPLGELALEQGVCTPDELAHALALQARTSPAPLELMRRDPRIDEAALSRALEAYLRGGLGTTER